MLTSSWTSLVTGRASELSPRNPKVFLWKTYGEPVLNWSELWKMDRLHNKQN